MTDKTSEDMTPTENRVAAIKERTDAAVFKTQVKNNDSNSDVLAKGLSAVSQVLAQIHDEAAAKK